MNVTVRNVITSMRLISWFDWAQFVESVSLIDEALPAPVAAPVAARASPPWTSPRGTSTATRSRRSPEPPAPRNWRSPVPPRPWRARGRPEARGTARSAAGGTGRPRPPVTRNRSRLLPDLRRTAGPRTRARGSAVARRPAPPRLPASRDRRLSRQPRLAHGPCPRRPRSSCRSPAADGGLALVLVAIVGLGPASDLAVSLVEPRRRGDARPEVVAPARAARGRAERPAHPGRRADAPGKCRGLGRARRRARDPLPGEPGRRHPLRAPVRLARRADGDDARRRRRCWRPPRPASSASTSATARRPAGAPASCCSIGRRRWNEAEGRWMGWERKRGKLHELNALLRGSTTTDILTTSADETLPPAGDSLRRHARFRHEAAPRRRRSAGRNDRPPAQPGKPRSGVGPGHAAATASSSHGSRPRCRPSTRRPSSSGAYSGAAGIDPYASAVSDVYQDLFGEGSYTGKGIYDLDAFEAAMADRVPENALLSHDLFEGIFARAGLVTDIELFDEFPSNYLEARARQHRWARGDWQLLPWILGRARDAQGNATAADPCDRALEDDRQPAPDGVRAIGRRDPGRGLAGPDGAGACLDRPGRRLGADPGADPGLRRVAASPAGHLKAKPPAGRRRTTSDSPRSTSGWASRSSPTRHG